jgi:hypothetical protein
MLPGTVLGPFRYAGTRPDDPNDLVPHEHRRELRALRVFGAWTNLVDWKAGNTLDTLVEENGRSIVKHYLQDVGSSLGMANNKHEWDTADITTTARRPRSVSSRSLFTPQPVADHSLHRISVDQHSKAITDPTSGGAADAGHRLHELRADDAFWAARRVMAFSDDLIRRGAHRGVQRSGREGHLWRRC